MTQSIVFWILAVVGTGAALTVVFQRDIFRAALFLILCFFTVAGIYITLNADFLGAVQVLIYIGAVAVLLIFAIMLTRDAPQGNPLGRFRFPAFVLAVLLLVSMIFVAVKTSWGGIASVSGVVQLPLAQLEQPASGITQQIATALFSKDGFILPLEIAATLLLAAIIGAITLVREK